MPNTTRRVYSAEELHRLRGSQSQPKLHEAIEEHDSEDAEIVKGHVIRGSKSFTARSFRSRNVSGNSLHVPIGTINNENASSILTDGTRVVSRLTLLSGGVLGEIPANGQNLRPTVFRLGPSPTPSIKKKKAEALVKNHGSPQHVRVTAGGRIVPSEQSPLTYPRYGYSAVKANGGVIKFAPNLHGGHEIRDHATEENFIAQDENGNFCQIIDGVVKPIRIVNGSYQLERNPPNVVDQSTQSDLSWCLDKSLPQAGISQNVGPESPATREPSVATQIAALELEYRRLELEAKDVDKTEALYGRAMPKAALSTLVASRRRLVTEKDKIRVSLKFLRKLKNRSASSETRSPNARNTPRFPSPPRPRANNFMPMQQSNGPNYSNTPYAPFYPGPMQTYATPIDNHMGPPGEETYNVPWMSPPPGVFMPNAAYDGSLGPPFVGMGPVGPMNAQELASVPFQTTAQEQIPQTDGARSLTELHAQAGKSSHAVPIRPPDLKSATGVRSNLNPMSPVYRPSGKPHAQDTDRQLAQVGSDSSVAHGSQLSGLILEAPADRTMRTSEDTISQTKKVTHLHSSSISSIDTADFFPRNPCEYSTRQLDYPLRLEHSDDKENTSPEGIQHRRDESPTTLPGQDNRDSNWNPVLPDEVFRAHASEACPVEVPSTSLLETHHRATKSHDIPTGFHNESNSGPPFSPSALPNRDEDNTSPKTKREFLFIEEHPEQLHPSSPLEPGTHTPYQDQSNRESRPVDMLDFSQKPNQWIEGYQAGLQRKPIGAHHMGDFLDGYCSGLLKSRPTPQHSSSSSARKTTPGSTLHRSLPPLPLSAAESPTLESRSPAAVRRILDDLPYTKEDLKQAVFAPQNEQAILSPAANGPHVDEQPTNLGAWAKSASARSANASDGYPFARQASPILHRHAVTADAQQGSNMNEMTHRVTGTTSRPQQSAPIDTAKKLPPVGSPTSKTASPVPDQRVTSLNTASPRPHVSRRMVSGWNPLSATASSGGPGAGQTISSQFPGSQYDGAPGQSSRRIMSDPVPNTTSSRFHEESIDGRSSPALSPRLASNPPSSPPLSPGGSYGHDSKRGTRHSSPSKTASPTKTKMEQIVGKVGIKVLSYSATSEAPGEPEPISPGAAGKRRWRDVWRSGKQKETTN